MLEFGRYQSILRLPKSLNNQLHKGLFRQRSKSAVRIIRPLKTILDLSFFPILEDSRIESVAEAARRSMDFKDWRKNSNAIELVDKIRRERMIFERHRVCVEIDSFQDELKRYKDGTSESALAAAVGSQRARPVFQTALLELEGRKAIVCLPEFKPAKSKPTKGWKLTSDN